MGKYGKKNQISLNPLDYNIMLLGSPKTGKTSLIKEVCEKLIPQEDGYLFLEIGSERGADAINGINYINCPEWNIDYDEYTNSAGFADVCNDIIENRTTDYKDLKVIIFDTYDQLIDIAEKESIRLYNKEQRKAGKPTVNNVNSAWGGYYRGEKVALNLMMDFRDKLHAVGVKTLFIGHVKNKDIPDAVTGESYQQITSDQQQYYFNPLKKSLHFLALAYISRDIIQKKRNDTKVNMISGEARKIRFRDNSYVVDCGSRFADITPEIDMNADAFIKAMQDAILAEQKKSGVSIDKAKKEQQQKEEERLDKIAEKQSIDKQLSAKKKEIVEFFKANIKDTSKTKPVLDKVQELGHENPTVITKVEDADAVLEMIKGM